MASVVSRRLAVLSDEVLPFLFFSEPWKISVTVTLALPLKFTGNAENGSFTSLL